jgi:hypothetical protein
MRPSELLPQFADRLNAKRVYSEPYQQDGVTIITAAALRGGGGIREDTPDRERGGMGLVARPVGAYVIRNGRVVWKPAFDLSRIALRGQLLVLTGLLVLGLILSRRRVS